METSQNKKSIITFIFLSKKARQCHVHHLQQRAYGSRGSLYPNLIYTCEVNPDCTVLFQELQKLLKFNKIEVQSYI